MIGLVACSSTQIGEPVRGEAVEVEIASATIDEPSLQLSIRSSDTRALPIKIKNVELVEESGLLVATFTPQTPMRWNDQGTFVAWNETVGGGEILAATYSLGTPSWQGGAHYNRAATYRMKVTVSIGTKERTVEKKVTVRPEPPIET